MASLPGLLQWWQSNARKRVHNDGALRTIQTDAIKTKLQNLTGVPYNIFWYRYEKAYGMLTAEIRLQGLGLHTTLTSYYDTTKIENGVSEYYTLSSSANILTYSRVGHQSMTDNESHHAGLRGWGPKMTADSGRLMLALYYHQWFNVLA